MNYLQITFLPPIIYWGLAIVGGTISYFFLDKYNKKYVAEQEEKDRRDTVARLSKKKVATAIENLKRTENPRWSDLLHIARCEVLPNGKPDVTKFSQFLPKIHRADLQELVRVDQKTTKKIRWDGGEMHLALTLLEEVVKYNISINNEDAIQNIAQQLHRFLKYCKTQYEDFTGYKKLIKKVLLSPTLSKTLDSRYNS